MIANDAGDRVTPAVVAFTDHDKVGNAFHCIRLFKKTIKLPDCPSRSRNIKTCYVSTTIYISVHLFGFIDCWSPC